MNAQYALIRTSSGELAYITKCFDRVKRNKIHVEDLCQLSELFTEQKYKRSYERVGKIIRQYTTNSGLDAIRYLRLVLFSFLVGNNDMHLKNFSLVHTQNGVFFSPAYDLLNENLIFHGDKEELALTLAGRKRKIKRSDFDQFATSLEITDIVRNNVYKDFSNQIYKAVNLINRSFLNTDYKERYINILHDKFKQLGL